MKELFSTEETRLSAGVDNNFYSEAGYLSKLLRARKPFNTISLFCSSKMVK
jgi:hypothetical protein